MRGCRRTSWWTTLLHRVPTLKATITSRKLAFAQSFPYWTVVLVGSLFRSPPETCICTLLLRRVSDSAASIYAILLVRTRSSVNAIISSRHYQNCKLQFVVLFIDTWSAWLVQSPYLVIKAHSTLTLMKNQAPYPSLAASTLLICCRSLLWHLLTSFLSLRVATKGIPQSTMILVIY